MESKQVAQGLKIVRKPAWLLTGVLAIALTAGASPVGSGDQTGAEQHQPATYLEAGVTTCTLDSTWEAPPTPRRPGEPY